MGVGRVEPTAYTYVCMAVTLLFFLSILSAGGSLLFISLDFNDLPRRYEETFYNPPRKFLKDFTSACRIINSSKRRNSKHIYQTHHTTHHITHYIIFLNQ